MRTANYQLALAVCVSLAQTIFAACPNLKADYPAPLVADGWQATLIANDLKAPRGIVFDTEGRLLVLDKGVGVVYYEFNDGGSGCIETTKKETLIEATDVCIAAPDADLVLIPAS